MRPLDSGIGRSHLPTLPAIVEKQTIQFSEEQDPPTAAVSAGRETVPVTVGEKLEFVSGYVAFLALVCEKIMEVCGQVFARSRSPSPPGRVEKRTRPLGEEQKNSEFACWNRLNCGIEEKAITLLGKIRMNLRQLLRRVALIAVALAMLVSLNIRPAAADTGINGCSSDENQDLDKKGCVIVEGNSANGVTLTNNGNESVTLKFGAAGLVQTYDSASLLGPYGDVGYTEPKAKYPGLTVYSLVLDCDEMAPQVLKLSANNVVVKPGNKCLLKYNDGEYSDNLGEYVVDYYQIPVS